MNCNMFNSNNFCFLCLTFFENVAYSNKMEWQEKLKYFIPKQVLYKSKVTKHICDHCVKNVNDIYEFRTKCIENIEIFNKYTQKSTQEPESYKRLSDASINEKLEIYNIENDIGSTNKESIQGIKVKTNLFGAVDSISSSENQPEESLQSSERIEQTSIKFDDTTAETRVKKEIDDELIMTRIENCTNSVNGNQIDETWNNIEFVELPVTTYYEKKSEEKNYNILRKEIYETDNESEVMCVKTEVTEEFLIKNESDPQKDIQSEQLPNPNLFSLIETESVAGASVANENDYYEEYDDCTPTELQEQATGVGDNLSEKSKERYELAYQNFVKWQSLKKTQLFTESIVLSYFEELALIKKYTPTTLWTIYSMLNTTFQRKHQVEIAKYKQLTAFLKRQNVGYVPKRSKVFQSEDIEEFLLTAPDDRYLVTKVAMIFGVVGGCRGGELPYVTLNDIEEQGNLLLVNIPDTKTHVPRSFTILPPYVNYVKSYAAVRPSRTPTDRFFLNYQKGKCTKQPIGKNKFATMAKEIAKFLQLEEPHLYTSHSFRRTSALFTNAGASTRMLHQHRGCKSTKVADYVEKSLASKRKIAIKIAEMNDPQPKLHKTCAASTT